MTKITIPGGFVKEDMIGYTDYALDHIEHFNGLPFEYENYETGKVYNSSECWDLAVFLELPDLIED